MLSLELLTAYLTTVVLDGAGVMWSGPGAAVDAVPDEVWVITAENPRSVPLDPEVNLARNAALAAAVRAGGHEAVPLVGRSPDASWSEACFAVTGAQVGEVCGWGRRFDQHAVFLLTVDDHVVVDCDTEREVARRARRVGGSATP